MSFEISMKYFGMVVDHTKIPEEILSFNQSVTLDELNEKLVQKYPGLGKLVFRFAVDQELRTSDFVVDKSVEIALLPAYAGG